jgi:predicted PurR-regulated permease PerM
MNLKPTARVLLGVSIIALSIWILQSFLLSLLVACVTAIASWPLYERFTACLPARMRRSAGSLVFTSLITGFVLTPLLFALSALLGEAHTLLLQMAAADTKGIAVPEWLPKLPLAGAWLAQRWGSELAHPRALAVWMERSGPTALLGWAESIGQFMVRHLLIIGFTILLLFFLYKEGASLAQQLRQFLRHHIGERADSLVQLATRAIRASVNSMLLVALFDGFATALAYAIAGVPHAAMWAAIIASLALVPFLGYAGVLALALQLAMADDPTTALFALALGCMVLLCGDKVVRPALARDGTRLRFVWVLMGCLGGFEALGLVGVVIGPVVLTLARELWAQRVRDLDVAEVNDAPSTEAALTSAATSRLLLGDPMVLPSAHAGRQSDADTLA